MHQPPNTPAPAPRDAAPAGAPCLHFYLAEALGEPLPTALRLALAHPDTVAKPAVLAEAPLPAVLSLTVGRAKTRVVDAVRLHAVPAGAALLEAGAGPAGILAAANGTDAAKIERRLATAAARGDRAASDAAFRRTAELFLADLPTLVAEDTFEPYLIIMALQSFATRRRPGPLQRPDSLRLFLTRDLALALPEADLPEPDPDILAPPARLGAADRTAGVVGSPAGIAAHNAAVRWLHAETAGDAPAADRLLRLSAPHFPALSAHDKLAFCDRAAAQLPCIAAAAGLLGRYRLGALCTAAAPARAGHAPG